LLLDDPEVYGLPSHPKVPSQLVPRSAIWSVFTGILVALGVLFSFRQRTLRANAPGAPNRPDAIKPNRPDAIKPNRPDAIKPNRPDAIKPEQPRPMPKR
jgi:hypothetical protein